MSTRPQGCTAKPPKLLSAEMSMIVYNGGIRPNFFSILNIKETRKWKGEIIFKFALKCWSKVLLGIKQKNQVKICNNWLTMWKYVHLMIKHDLWLSRARKESLMNLMILFKCQICWKINKALKQKCSSNL